MKVVPDRNGIPPAAYDHVHKAKLPSYQWTACCVRTRTRFIAYSREKTFSNGLCFMILVVLWLRAHGILHQVNFQTDWGEEFGGKSPKKLTSVSKITAKPPIPSDLPPGW